MLLRHEGAGLCFYLVNYFAISFICSNFAPSKQIVNRK